MTRESQLGHGLLTLSRIPTRGKTHQTLDQVHALCIITGPMGESAKAAIALEFNEQLNWMACAAERGCSLVVLSTVDTLEFYTTDRDRFIALRPVMQSMAERVRAMPSLGQTSVIQLVGPRAARRLFAHAAQFRPSVRATSTTANAIHKAAALSAASTALGPTLASLFRAAANVARRIRQETILESEQASESQREIEVLAAERIVEEELATWQAQEAELQRAANELPELEALATSSFSRPEPASEVRLRVGTRITPRISYVLEPKRAS